ncbi:MAG: carbohydrate-binding domain-containing protein [Planctomycetota bacterium]|jgi:hypothetical protein
MDYWNGDDVIFTQEMASRGFVAVSVEYDNGWNTGGYPSNCSGILAKAAHIFDRTDPGSAISVISNLPGADCDLGIVTSGFIQGANLASLAKNYDDRVEAAFLIGNGYTGWFDSCLQDSATVITTDRIRSIVGAHDTAFGASPPNGVRIQQEVTTGISCGGGAYDCMQPDGSGWYMVQTFETADGDDDHCFYYSGTCGYAFDDNFLNGTDVWSLAPSLDWLASFALEDCPAGDLDGDCEVGISDLQIFALGWLTSDVVADIDGSGTADVLDFSIIAENWLNFTIIPGHQMPYPEGIAHAIPGRLEFEDYDFGGQDIAYFDTIPQNSYADYRSDDVEILSSLDTDGGFAVYAATNEWLEYTCDILPGTYAVTVRSSSSQMAQTLTLSLDEQTLATFSLPTTGGFNSWQDTTISGVEIPDGSDQILRFTLSESSAMLNYVDFLQE